MIEGLARAGRVLDGSQDDGSQDDGPKYIEAASKAADFILENLRDADGRLLRTWRRGTSQKGTSQEGTAKLPAYLNDYAFFPGSSRTAQGNRPGPLAPAQSPVDQSSAADAIVSEPPLHVRAFAPRDQVQPGALLRVDVQIEIDEPWHIYSQQPGSEIPIKTRLTLESEHATLEAVRYPPSQPLQDPSGGKTLNTFSGKVMLWSSPRKVDSKNCF